MHHVAVPPPPTVRAATPADAADVWPLARGFATSFTPQRGAFEATVEALLSDDRALLLIAEGDARVVGYLLAFTHPTFFANAPVTWVEEVMVSPDRRRSGVGTALMSAVTTWSVERGCAYTALATRRAKPFYEALGYEDSATFYRHVH